MTDDRVFEILLADLTAIPGSPLAYWMSDSVRSLFANRPAIEPAAGRAGKGHDTGDDVRFIRASWEVDPSRVGASLEDTYRGKPWISVAKGGAYSPYWSDLSLLVDWRNDGEDLKQHPKAYPRNLGFNFSAGLTWPRRTNSAFGMRVRPAGSILVDKGAGLQPSGDPYVLLGWMRSRLAQALMDSMVAAGEEVSSGGASRSYEVGLVQKMPWVDAGAGCASVTRRLVERRMSWDAVDETTRRFVSPFSLAAPSLGSFLEQLEDAAELDALIVTAASIGAEGERYLDEENSPQPFAYDERWDVDDEIERFWEMPLPAVIDELIQQRGGVRAIARMYFVADRRIEIIAHGLEVSPRSIVRVAADRGLKRPGEQEALRDRIISYLVGVAFGRWDVRVGAEPERAVSTRDPLAAPPPFAPGALVDDEGGMTGEPPKGYPLHVSETGVLVDDPGHDLDLPGQLAEAAREVGTVNPSLADELAWIDNEAVRGIIRRSFFRSHLATYTSRPRKAPIYWQLQVPSKKWGVWLYLPRISREMLFAVVRETEQRQRLAEQQITALQHEYDDGGAGRTLSAVSKELDAEQKLAVELVTFRDEAERIANLGWDPDLDDGAVLNAAPFASLFPAWKDAGKYRTELRQGKHTWSTVSKYADQL